MEGVALDVHSGQGFVRDFFAGLIPVCVKSRINVEPCLRGRMANYVDNDLMANE